MKNHLHYNQAFYSNTYLLKLFGKINKKNG